MDRQSFGENVGACRRGLLAVAVAAAMTASVAPRGALAQEQTGQSQLEEIVVTATKAATGVDVSKVPVSITAFDGNMIDTLNAKDFEDLAIRTPGVVLTESVFAGLAVTNIQIRGISSRTSEPTTGMYLDDVPFTTIGNNTNIGGSVALPVVFDLNRVEVLRGPQGTLFGSTSEGGAVRLIPNAPSLKSYSQYARTELGSTEDGGDTYEAGYAIGGPIVEDKVGFRFSAWYRDEGGWIDHCQPAVKAPGCLYVIEPDANSQVTEAARFALTWKPNDRLSVEPSINWQSLKANDPTGYEILASDPDNGIWSSDHSTDQSTNDQLTVASVRLTWDLDKLVLTNVTALVKRYYDFTADYTEYQDWAFFGNPYPLTGAADDFGFGYYGIDQDDLTEEFRVASNNGGRWTWVTGIFLSDQKQYDFAHVIHPDLPALVLANYGLPIDQVLGVPFYLGQWVAFNDVHTHSQEVAVFGNVDWHMTDKWTLTMAGRSTHYTQHVNSFIAGPFNGGSQSFDADASGNPFTPKVAVSWQATDKTMYYFNAAKGFRIGGVNPQIDNAQPACQAAKPGYIARGLVFSHAFEPDSLWSYELGVKTRQLNNRLSIDASAYHIDWTNIQNPEGVAGCGFSMIFNLGEAKSNGFDVNLQTLIGEHVKFNTMIGHTTAEYTTTVQGLVTAGEQITGPGSAVPPWTASVATEFDFKIGKHNSYAWIEDIYHSKNHGRFNSQTPADVATYNPLLPVNPETNMVNMRLGMRLSFVDASLFVNNATNEHPVMTVSDAFYPDPRLTATTWRPRTIGINGTFRF
jgi:outer membrane receptor protein involved in Fe transport